MKIKKTIINHNFGYIKVKPTQNNIFLTVTDINGNVLLSKHAGLLNYKGSKKKTPFVASQIVANLINNLNQSNINIKLYILQIKGYLRNSSISSIIKELNELKVNNIFYIEYVNMRIHGDLRLKKKRRL